MSSRAGAESRARRILRWLAPSLIATLAAAAIAGLIDAATYADGPTRIAVTAGFAVALAAPVLLALALAVRAAVATWRPRALIARLTDADGAAPRLAGWLLGGGLGLALVAVATHQTVIVLARATAWKPRTISVLFPLVMVAAVAIIAIATVPIAAGLGRALAALEAWRARRRGRPTLTPTVVLLGTALVLAAAAAAAWLIVVRPLIRTLALDGAGFVVVALAVLAAVHLSWGRLPRPGQAAVTATALVLALGLGASATWARLARPTLLLGLWGNDGFGALAIDVVVNIRKVRAAVPAAALRPTPRPGAPRRDIILLTIDTFRPDRLAAYGGPVSTPALAGLAARGTIFDLALAPSNVTRRSLPALATGVAATRVRGRVAGWALRLDPRHITIAERLRAGGYRTVGLFCCEGFWSATRPTGLEGGFGELVIEHDADALVAALAQRLAARPADDPPLFAWLHFIELHEWAGGDPDMRPEHRRLYDDALGRVDASVGRLAEAIAALPPERQPIVIVTGDHSEALGDHGQPFHSSDLYNSQVQVPLIIAGPGVAVRRVDEAVSLLDLAPTILALAGFEPLPHPWFDGRPLDDLVTGARAPDPAAGRAYAAMIVDRFMRTGRLALVVGRWKLIRTLGGKDELYDLGSDPRELADRAATSPAELRRMQGELEAQRARDRASPFWQ
ncbi:MAG: sulfatase [Myxococcales bacterium]|nr:sulfatase [Myxococcales bacterium]